MKIIIAALLYIVALLVIISAIFMNNINHATLDAVLALFLVYIGREFFEKGAK